MKANNCLGCPYIYSKNADSFMLHRHVIESYCRHLLFNDDSAIDDYLGTNVSSEDFCTPDWCPLLDKQVKENNEDVAEVIPAKKANQIAEDANKKCLRDQLLLINDGILKAANEGCYEFCCDLCVDREVKHILEEAGYTVETRDYDNSGVQLLTKIAWYKIT